MSEIETYDEDQAMHEAFKAWEGEGFPRFPATFEAGWLAGRDWARQQMQSPSVAQESPNDR